MTNASVVKQHIQPPEGFYRLRDHAFDGTAVGHIYSHRQCLAACLFNRGDYIVRALLIHVTDHNLRAMASEVLSNTGSQASSGTGHDDHFAFYNSAHNSTCLSYLLGDF
ncbi:hypothetical protein D3C80_1385090 [compost metagenome]